LKKLAEKSCKGEACKIQVCLQGNTSTLPRTMAVSHSAILGYAEDGMEGIL